MPHGFLAFSGLLVGAIFISTLAPQLTPTLDGGRMPASFVLEFTSLLLFGPGPAMLVSTAAAATRRLTDAARAQRLLTLLANAATIVIAMLGAAVTYSFLGGTQGDFSWPFQAVPIAAAVVGYCIVKSVSTEVIAPLVMRRRINRAWPNALSRECPTYVIGATLAVGFVELIDHQMWQVLAIAAVPLYFAYRLYCDYGTHLEAAHRRREVIDSLDQGMSVVDGRGQVTLWNDELERMLRCPRERALGGSMIDAVPMLGNTELPRAVDAALMSRTSGGLVHLTLPFPTGAKILHVKILTEVGGATLRWHDLTGRSGAEHALKRSEERLALVAEGANDGLWEWDLRTQELYFSARWRAMMGLAAAGGTGRPEEWIDRVHADDVAGLKEALKAHLDGRTKHLQHEHRIRHEDGTFRWFLCRGVAVRGVGRRAARIAGSLTDTTDRATAQEQVRSAGFVDPLTGLRNRAEFVEGLGRRLEEFKHNRSGGRFAVLYLDLDRFKIVNDSLGHLVGDELLVAVSRRLESCLRPGDSLARLGGDEFAILLNTVGDEQQANVIAFQIQEVLSASVSVGGREVFTSASIGIAFGDKQHGNPDEIMRDADTAMYHAKAHGKARHELFDADMHARERDRLGLESDLRRAVTAHDFEVHYQPIVLLNSGMCVGFESLVRWTRDGKAVSPVTFIPIAEELGLIEALGTWVLQQACETFADWQRRFPDRGLDCITVNVSSRQLMQHQFLYIVEQAVHAAGLKPCDLRIEITETALMDSPAVAAEVLRKLREFGVKIYLDDFGTGYSSLSHLHKLPVDALKIDRSFVKSLLLADRPAIVESILALARTLNTSVVAEGIESEVQWRELERLGCTHAQGFLFSRPVSTQAAEAIIIANQPLGPKRDQAADTRALDNPELGYPSAPFKWPEHIPARKSSEVEDLTPTH